MWFVSLDGETTGLDRLEQEVIELKATALTRTLDAVGTFYTKIKMVRPELASPEALKLNHYSEEEWADAPSAEEAYSNFADWMEGMRQLIPYLDDHPKNRYPIALGQNPGFDVDFACNHARRHGVELKFSYHLFDLVTISIFMDIVNSIKEDFEWQQSYSLTKVAKANNIKMAKAHTAEVDEETHLKLLRLYIDRIRNGHCSINAAKC